MPTRREFIMAGTAMAGSTALAHVSFGSVPVTQSTTKKMILRFRPYTLQLKHAFTLASGSRTTTPVMLTEIEYEGITGFGEASMPPYLGESHETAARFLQKINLAPFGNPFRMDDLLSYVDSVDEANYAAKASVDIALHDLVGKLLGKPWFEIWGYSAEKTPDTSFTIAIDVPDVVRAKTLEAAGYHILKIKLGRGNDREMIETVRSVTRVPLCVDVNQGWKGREEALDMIHWLKEQGVVFVEQPLPKENIDDHAWLTERSPLPIIADEAVQTPADLKQVYGAYSGINVKLMKCGGMRNAQAMLHTARTLGMQAMIGCMTETSCAVSAAAQLSPLCKWADLDGNLLISNDLFSGIEVRDGKVMLSSQPGIGVIPNHP